MPRALTFGSVFSGVGGLDLGFEQAGMRCLWQVEINPWCRKVLEKRFPHADRRWTDATRFAWWAYYNRAGLPSVDCICGGFPCQPHSIAGRRLGEKDHRHLWPEMLDVVAAFRPPWFVGENTPGIITTCLDTVLSDLGALGYQAAPFVIPACAFGAEHIRERVFILAHFDGAGLPLSEPAGFPFPAEAPPEQRRPASEQAGRTVESGLVRVLHGVPGRVDRIRSLGNAVYPPVAEEIGRAIMTAHFAYKAQGVAA